jgi:hypothetical protein
MILRALASVLSIRERRAARAFAQAAHEMGLPVGTPWRWA